MKVYVLSEAKEYLYNGTDWEEVGGISDEELQQLTVAYNHSQTAHITEEYVNQAISEAHENIQLDNYVTKEEFDSLEQIQTSESRPRDEDISIWIDISDDAEMDEVARINDNVIANNEKYPSNWELSAERAINVLHYLADYGVNENSFSVAGYADTRPKFSNDTAEGRAYNRRVDIIILDEGHF